MRVHFIGSKSNIAEDIVYYREILRVIVESGHELLRDWIEDAYKMETSKSKDDADWRSITHGNAQATTQADVVIGEATTRSFAVGYQTAQAMQQKNLFCFCHVATP